MSRSLLSPVIIALILLAAIAFAWLITPIFAGDGVPRLKTLCLSQIKQTATASMIYISDFDERFPHREWMTALKPYTKNDDLYTCPALKYAKEPTTFGYAMNWEVAGVDSMKMADPSKMVLFFETDALGPSVLANLAARSLTRHGTGPNAGSNVSYCDSSAKFRVGTVAP